MSTPAETSRYKVFSTEKYRNAPFTKIWSCCTFAGSCALIPFYYCRHYFLLPVEAVFSGKQLWKVAISKLFFLQFKDIIAGCLLIYYMRHIERRYSSRKFCDFLFISGLFAISLELMLYYTLKSYEYLPSPFFPSGPYSLLFACLVQFIADIPFVPYAKLFGISLSIKNLPYLFAVQLFISSKEVSLSCVTGIIAGLLYRYNFCYFQNLSVVPDWLCNLCNKLLGPVLRLGEDQVGRILPIGATVEAQRQDLMDRYEQRLIFSQVQRQHMQDRRRNVAVELFAGRRWFGGGGGQGNEVQAAEDKIRALMDMGFNNRGRVEQVLRNTNNDLNSAAHILLQESTN